jgi:hypothetical protein
MAGRLQFQKETAPTLSAMSGRAQGRRLTLTLHLGWGALRGARAEGIL